MKKKWKQIIGTFVVLLVVSGIMQCCGIPVISAEFTERTFSTFAYGLEGSCRLDVPLIVPRLNDMCFEPENVPIDFEPGASFTVFLLNRPVLTYALYRY
jgi:hypothetical protein